ncbi:MAG: threonine/serine exporter family protein [Firmicutes bacterium]|jgi:uncharacterized membrane protein YjjB (DUF3815 family)|nr:threonine/serine exporter family protein [Bacillota bacterium]
MIKEFVFSFICTVGFSVIFHTPKKYLAVTGLCGAVAWTLYKYVFLMGGSIITSNFIGAFGMAVLSEILSRICNKPATFFIIPGIIPLVPGYAVYYTMFSLINNDYDKFAQMGADTAKVALAIACGIIVASSIGRVILVMRGHKVNMRM